MDTNKWQQTTADMLDWLNTWRQDDGAYNGWVVHRFDLKRLKHIHDTPWEQTPIIDGLFNLYRATGNDKYYQMAKQSVELQISRLDRDTGMFDNAGFEDDRFSSLVHNALADCALMTFVENCKNEDEKTKELALETVKLNLDKYFLGELYCEDAKAFKFSKIDFYWTRENRYVANMNSVAIEAMIRYFAATGEKIYYDISMEVLPSVTSLFCAEDGKMECGGIGYANTHPKWYISIYTALALRGLCEVYKHTKEESLRKIMIDSAKHLIRYSQNNYFCHAIHDGIQNPYPYWIAGGGMILKGIDDVARLTGERFDVVPFVEKIIGCKQSCGGVSSFKKYNATDNHRRRNRPQKEVWEDRAPGAPWNAHLFEYLTRFATKDFDEFVPQNKTSFVIKPSYVYYESKKTFFVVSFLPLFSCALVWINKKKSHSVIGFSLRHLYAKIIRMIRR